MKYLLLILISACSQVQPSAKTQSVNTTAYLTLDEGPAKLYPDTVEYTTIMYDTVGLYSRDTIPCILMVSNTKKPMGVWTIRGYKVDSIFLGKNKKPIPSYIEVWDYKLSPTEECTHPLTIHTLMNCADGVMCNTCTCTTCWKSWKCY